MVIAFYIAAAIAIIATILVISSYNIVHALLYLVISFLAVAVVFFVLGAPFVAALEVIVYAGAIVVLIIFVIMMLSLKKESTGQEKLWLTRRVWIGPALLAVALMSELVYVIITAPVADLNQHLVDSKAVGISLYSTYVIGVELCGILLMAGIVGAYHLGRQKKKIVHRFLEATKE